MTCKLNPLRMSLAATALVTGLLFDGDFDRLFASGSPVSQAEARIGRPLTPISGAGVVRRTTRRVIRRGAYIAHIPVGCHYGTYHGYSAYHCNGHYYQKSGSGYVIVYF